MPEILYSDIEVTAKVVMDPRTMDVACNYIKIHHITKEMQEVQD